MPSITKTVNAGQENPLPFWIRQKRQRFAILTVMAKRKLEALPKPDEGKLFLAERMAVRGIDATALAAAVEKPYTTVWRWIEGERRPHRHLAPRLAKALHCTVAQLYKHPNTDSEAELLDGLDEDGIKAVREVIAFQRWKNANPEK